jgi:hypothetical protein
LPYYVAFPELGNPVALEAAEPLLQSCAVQKTWGNGTAYKLVLKMFTDEECKVVEVLAVHEEKYLKKYIRKETGLNRLKPRRIVARLAERGILTLEDRKLQSSVSGELAQTIAIALRGKVYPLFKD